MKIKKQKLKVISLGQHIGTNRADRRKHFRQRVRNSGIETVHPDDKKRMRHVLMVKRIKGFEKNLAKDLRI